MKANYTYLSDGTKAAALNASGAGYDYAGSFTYSHASNGTKTLESVAFGGGRIRRTGTNSYAVDYYITDHLGSVRAIVNASGTIQEQNDYYPFGTRHPNGLATLSANRWRFGGKEEQDASFGIAYSDFGARLYDRSAAWTAIDPLAEKYYSVSPYAYCNNNPIGIIDVKGDSLAVLNLGQGVGHSALLIQNEGNKWEYYSYNGTWVYDMSRTLIGGKPYHDLGNKTFNSPQAFLDSSYNRAGSPSDVEEDIVNNYGFPELFVLPTTPSQDQKVRETFRKEAQKRYSLVFSHQCANVVEKSLEAAGVKTEGHLSYFPNMLFENIKKSNPNGLLKTRTQ